VDYHGYFRTHYKSKFSEEDVTDYLKWFASQWRLIKREAPVPQGARVLEIGSGIGGFFAVLNRSVVADYTGIELDQEACAFANEHFKSAVFRNVSLEELPSDELYDCIYAFEVLEHLENPSEAVEKIYSLLEPGGTFCGTTPFPFKKNVLADDTHLSVLHPKNWERLFLNAGFSTHRNYAMSFPPLIWRVSPWLNIRLPFYVPISRTIATCLIIATKSH
jgi:2-polyprenyl-3-methyl-5-hydroxy-6-metoxy-1,4-benzoquinol methylase